MTNITAWHQALDSNLEHHAATYVATAQAIFQRPETGNNEYFASEQLTGLLLAQGFQVTCNVAGHETAFYAEKRGDKPGPTVAFLAEYDALSGIGHACGHNLIGTTSVAAAITLSQLLAETGGRVVVLGTPAEEGGLAGPGGPKGNVKKRFVEAGLLEGVDAALMVHPAGKTRLTEHTLANNHLYFHFYGKPSHAASAPHEGINALDALVLLYNGISVLRQQLPDGVRVHGIITNGGQAANVIPEYASAHYYIRADSREQVESLEPRLRAIAEGVALATGTRVEIDHQVGPRDFRLNPALDAVLLEELTTAGEQVDLSPQKNKVSTDAGDISHAVPTAHPWLKIGPDDLIFHTVPFREAANSERGYQALLSGAQVLARTGLRLLTDADTLQKIKADFTRL
ncbi:M20 family metallopeptidase [Pantoea vagans]|uniref:M20 family metallopeptidase n=1 Tax=Pantoea vagans TaxID=470934 RepID=UPI000CE670BD|nr:M20 family metallopeptidase [Pantoea vagans]AVE16803.1 amidohydrolase [Pantoea vagans]